MFGDKIVTVKPTGHGTWRDKTATIDRFVRRAAAAIMALKCSAF